MAFNDAIANGYVMGLKGVPTNDLVPRPEIDVYLTTNPDSFNIFAQALAAIHGIPIALWDGVQSAKKANAGGYCAHGTPQFPTWHRPYLAMLEQTIYAKMVEVAGLYNDPYKTTYQKAIANFRLPYWDYFRPRGGSVTFTPVFNGVKAPKTYPYDFGVPMIFTAPTLRIKTSGSPTVFSDLANPFISYTFPSSSAVPTNDWTRGGIPAGFSRSQTQRYPSATALSPVDQLNMSINNSREGNIGYMLHMMSSYTNYPAFASNGDDPTGGDSGSIEDIHGDYHVNIGGINGHMSKVPVAAFDPIFWFHHCQIDRLTAIWQAAHPNTWLSSSDNSAPLYPFRSQKVQGAPKYWDSNTTGGARSTAAFGYTYSELVGNLSPQQVMTNFAANYSWANRTNNASVAGTPPSNMTPVTVTGAPIFPQQSTTSSQVPIQSFAAMKVSVREDLPKISNKQIKKANPGAEASKAQAVGHQQQPLAEKQPSGAAKHAPIAKDRSFASLAKAKTLKIAPADVDESSINRTWFIDHIVERMALNDAFTIYYFIGGAPSADINTADYSIYPTIGGFSHNFVAPAEACDNCASDLEQARLITGTTVINPVLLDYVQTGQLADLSAEHVKPFLIQNLKWRVVRVTGELVDPRNVSELKIGISCKLVPSDGQGEVMYQDYPDIVTEIIENSS